MWSANASTFVEKVDLAFWFIAGVSIACLIGITLFILWCVFRYSKKRNPEATQIHGSVSLEILWTVIPSILVLVMFWYGWDGYIQQRRVPDDAYKVQVNAGKWYWKFTYPNGLVTNSEQGLHVPVNTPIHLPLVSDDVAHSFYVPAFRVKMDVIPKPEGARINYTWFEATKEGTFELLCAEYCGIDHARMLTKVYVHSEEDFEKWLTQATADAEEARRNNPGLALYKSKGCVACHTIDGTKGIGPSFKNIWGKKETVITKGKERKVTIDEKYIRTSILKPSADIVKGYQPLMNIIPLTDDEIEKIIQFIKELE